MHSVLSTRILLHVRETSRGSAQQSSASGSSLRFQSFGRFKSRPRHHRGFETSLEQSMSTSTGGEVSQDRPELAWYELQDVSGQRHRPVGNEPIATP